VKSRVIAVDPGYDRVGIAVMEKNTLLHSECFIPKKGELSARLFEVSERITALIHKYKPGAVALETLFFSKNQKTALKVAEARGAISLTTSQSGIQLFEYSPQEVKIAVTGSGNADKTAIKKMVDRLVVLPQKKRLDDEYDAIALAIAHTARHHFPS